MSWLSPSFCLLQLPVAGEAAAAVRGAVVVEFPRSFALPAGLFGLGLAAGAERELGVACGLAGVRVGVEAQPVGEGADGGGRRCGRGGRLTSRSA